MSLFDNAESRRLTAAILFEAGLTRVESASIRQWASAPKNRAVFEQWIVGRLAAGKVLDDAAVALVIVSNAIGLW